MWYIVFTDCAQGRRDAAVGHGHLNIRCSFFCVLLVLDARWIGRIENVHLEIMPFSLIPKKLSRIFMSSCYYFESDLSSNKRGIADRV